MFGRDFNQRRDVFRDLPNRISGMGTRNKLPLPGKQNRRRRRSDSKDNDSQNPADSWHRNANNETFTTETTSTEKSAPKETAIGNDLFRPNRLRASAPIPSLSPHTSRMNPSRTNQKQPSNHSSSRFESSYAKKMRSIESCQTPPRKRILDRKRVVTTPCILDQTDTFALHSRARDFTTSPIDRIEQSRSPDPEAHNTKTPLHFDIEDAFRSSNHGFPTESSACASKGSFPRDRLDRIEYTRENKINNYNVSKVLVSGFREKMALEDQRQCKTIESKNAFKKENDHVLTSRGSERIRTRDSKVNRKRTSLSSHFVHHHNPESMVSASDQKLPRSIQYQDFQALRLKYRKYIQNLLASTDADENPFVQTRNERFEPMIAVRSRQLLAHEIEKGNYSILDIPTESSRTLAMYETNMLPNKQKMDVKAHVFQFDAVYSERSSFDKFYSQTVQQSVDIAIHGGLGAILICGSDEFGKTNTLSGIQERLASHIFSGVSYSESSTRSFFLTHLGLTQNQSDTCIDLLSPMHHLVEVVKTKNVEYKAKGATELSVSSPSELLDALNVVQQNLVLEQIRESSSYSLCRIAIPTSNNGVQQQLGALYLVFCPSGDQIYTTGNGSTDRDEEKHNYEELNPLAKLMEAIRNKSRPEEIVHHPSCSLTKLLGLSIVAARKTVSGTRICLVACVSPCSDDTEATLSTMISSREYMTRRKPICSDSKPRNETLETSSSSAKSTKEDSTSRATTATDVTDTGSLVLPRQWSETQLWQWMQRKRFVTEDCFGWFEEKKLSGKAIMNMTKEELKGCFFHKEGNNENGRIDSSNKLFDALRAENDRVARLKLKEKFAQRKNKQK